MCVLAYGISFPCLWSLFKCSCCQGVPGLGNLFCDCCHILTRMTSQGRDWTTKRTHLQELQTCLTSKCTSYPRVNICQTGPVHLWMRRRRSNSSWRLCWLQSLSLFNPPSVSFFLKLAQRLQRICLALQTSTDGIFLFLPGKVCGEPSASNSCLRRLPSYPQSKHLTYKQQEMQAAVYDALHTFSFS